tara:strand:- start:51 stop:521 length:471 start_codon:yes stop_codon:yes gene_type:complete
MKSINMTPSLAGIITAAFVAFWISAVVLTIGLSIFTLVGQHQIIAIVLISMLTSGCWASWHKLAITDRYIAMRYTKYGIPHVFQIQFRDLERAILFIDELFSRKGRPEVSMELVKNDGRHITIFLGLYTPTQGRQYAEAMSANGLNVSIIATPKSR